ncbi:MAG: thiamine diphosphokinase [Lachnospiraceae bacterium]|nr:thiamine diphosphokinase [Lachnospiraceae bacterium]
MHILIITGGGIDIPFTHSYIEKQKFDKIYAADKGVQYAVQLGIRPDLILGDFDSLGEKMKEKMKDWNIPVLTFPPEKDYTDTHLAITHAISQGADEITLIGATGTRLDHTWANIGLLQMAMKEGVRAWIVDAHNRISMWNSGREMKKEEAFGDYVSLIPYTEKVTGITLTGFYYPLSDAELTLGISLGISNELISKTGKIEIGSGDLIIIESRD